MIERKRQFLLILILTIVSLSASGVTILMLYNAAFEEDRARLVNIAQSRARLIEAIARYDIEVKNQLLDETPDYDPFMVTMNQITDAHENFEGFGKTGEFTLARKSGEKIEFILRHRHDEVFHPDDISFGSELAAPMRSALSGKSGTLIGLDYRGEIVLAAFEPVAEVNLGIVAKIDLSEVRTPYIEAAITAMLISILLIFFGSFLFFRVTNPGINELVSSESRFRSVFESRVTGILFWDKNGNISDANDTFLEMVGYSRDDLNAGRLLWNEMTPPEYRERDAIAIEELASIGVSTPLEKEYICKDGSRIPIIIGAASMSGSELNGVAFILNNSDRKKAEEELKQYEIHMRQQQKLESIGTLAGGVAHEINNPINGIMNYASLIVKRLDKDSPLIEYASEIGKETERVSTIVRNLLTFSRQDKESHSPANIEDVINDTLSLIQSVIKHDQITLESDIPDDLPNITLLSANFA
ncbi:MAG: PAS domain S-box protein [Candidatus Hatepunaea meridiana]|nr:PAS domain S-box protein [Candidatus Hatepunaea meridiana]